MLKSKNIWESVTNIEIVPADDKDLALVHSKEHIQAIKDCSNDPDNGEPLGDQVT
jgi:acetoin utilization deacetylase AcuC-like enzyme